LPYPFTALQKTGPGVETRFLLGEKDAATIAAFLCAPKTARRFAAAILIWRAYLGSVER